MWEKINLDPDHIFHRVTNGKFSPSSSFCRVSLHDIKFGHLTRFYVMLSGTESPGAVPFDTITYIASRSI